MAIEIEHIIHGNRNFLRFEPKVRVVSYVLYMENYGKYFQGSIENKNCSVCHRHKQINA